MRRAITAISLMFCGTSVLVFMAALLQPVLRESPRSEQLRKDTAANAHLPSASGTRDLEAHQGEASSMQTDNGAPSPITTTAHTTVTDPESRLTPSEAPSPPTSDPSNAVDHSPATPTTTPATISEPSSSAGDLSSTINSAAGAKKNSAPFQQVIPTRLLVLNGGFFPPGEASLKKNAEKVIDKIMPVIKTHAYNMIMVDGHSDSEMSARVKAPNWNEALSLRRALSVASVLERKGIAKERIIVRGLGDTEPVASNFTEDGRAQNRRVEIKLTFAH